MSPYPGINTTTDEYDLGPPSYGVTENTAPNSTWNPAYKIAYRRWSLDAAAVWKRKLN